MTVLTDISKTTSIANGVTVSFPFNFKVKDEADLRVYVTDTDGNEVLIPDSEYSVTGVGGEDGTITYQPNGQPLSAGNKITVLREVPLTQTLAVTNQSNGVSLEAIEDRFDIITFQIQQNAEKIDRGVSLPVASTGDPLIFPSPEPGKILAWGGEGNTLVNTSVSTSNNGGNVNLPIGISDVSGLQSALNVKADVSTVVALQASLSDKADTDYVNTLAGGKLDVSQFQAFENNYNARTIEQNADVEIASPVANEVLRFNGSKWVNSPAGSSGGASRYEDLGNVVTLIDSGQSIRQFNVQSNERLHFAHNDSDAIGIGTLTVDRVSNYSGGSGVTTALNVINSSADGTTTFDWAGLFEVNNSGQGENVALYAKGTRKDPTGRNTWASVSEAADDVNPQVTPLTSDIVLIAHEFDIRAAGDDVFRNRVFNDLVLFNNDAKFGVSNPVSAHAGIRMEAVGFNSSDRYYNGVLIGDANKRNALGISTPLKVNNAINLFTDGDAALVDRGVKGYGLKMESTYNIAAIQVPTGSKISFNASDTITMRDSNGTLAVEGPLSAQALSVNATTGNILNSNGLRIVSNGKLEFLSNSIWRGSQSADFFFDGQGSGGDYIEVQAVVNGTTRRRYLPLYRHVNDS